MERNRFLIYGHIRSGKTVLAKILNHCKGVKILNESYMYSILVEEDEARLFFKKLRVLNGFRGFTPPTEKLVGTNKSQWAAYAEDYVFGRYRKIGDKNCYYKDSSSSPSSICGVGMPFKIIFLHRDGRDIASLNLRLLERKNKLSDLSEITLSNTTQHSIEKWVRTTSDWNSEKDNYNSIDVRFEDLALNRDIVLRQLSKFVDVPIGQLLEGYEKHFNNQKADVNIYPKIFKDWRNSFKKEGVNLLNLLGYNTCQ